MTLNFKFGHNTKLRARINVKHNRQESLASAPALMPSMARLDAAIRGVRSGGGMPIRSFQIVAFQQSEKQHTREAIETGDFR
jgi:hypothetical protein